MYPPRCPGARGRCAGGNARHPQRNWSGAEGPKTSRPEQGQQERPPRALMQSPPVETDRQAVGDCSIQMSYRPRSGPPVGAGEPGARWKRRGMELGSRRVVFSKSELSEAEYQGTPDSSHCFAPGECPRVDSSGWPELDRPPRASHGAPPESREISDGPRLLKRNSSTRTHPLSECSAAASACGPGVPPDAF
jgi:hypothetical protein